MTCCDDCGIELVHATRRERRMLIVALAINAGMFAAEFLAGILGGSSALLADSLDMLADAVIYAMSLFALGRAGYWRVRAAISSGVFQLMLGLGVAGEALWKMAAGGLPDVGTMGLFGVIALLANTVCFLLLTRFRDGDINLRAAWICSRNDMLANLGVLLAAVLVVWSGSPLPDTVIGLIIAAVVIHSAWRIVREAWESVYPETESGHQCPDDT